jgi:hypothetical protein
LRLNLPGMTGLIWFFLRKARNALSYPLSARTSLTPGIRLTQVSAITQSAVLPGVRTSTQGRAQVVNDRVNLAITATFSETYRLRLRLLFHRWRMR